MSVRIKEFEKFYELLMKEAPVDYVPWFFPCEKLGKNPSSDAILNIDPSSKGSWHHPSARLTKEQCIEHIKQGYNIGISAKKDDPLIIIDIDNPKYRDQLKIKTLTVTSRKRIGLHAFCWDLDGSAKINLPTDDGEIRSDNQYVLACGSYTPFNMNDKKDKQKYEELPEEIKKEKMLGYYTLNQEIVPMKISFSDVPQFFQDYQKKNVEWETKILQDEEKKEFPKEGKYADLFNLKMSDIVGLIPKGKRKGHPLHESDTDSNFSVSADGAIAHCWRHLVSLNPVQYLCVQAGYCTCGEAGTPHKGRGISKLRGDKKAFEIAYNEAVKCNLIKEYKPEFQIIDDLDKLTVKIIPKEKKKFITDEEFEQEPITETDWLVDGWIAKGDICGITAKRSSFKTTLLLHMCYAMAEGKLVFNKYQCKKSKILYLNEENHKSLFLQFIRRVKKGLDLQDIKTKNLTMCNMGNIRLENGDDIKEIVDYVKTNNIEVIIFDSFRRFFIGKEDSADVVSNIMDRLKRIRTACNDCSIILIHHAKKGVSEDGRDIARGSSDWGNSLDSEIIIDRKINQDSLIIRHGKNRSGPELQPRVLQIDMSDDKVYVWETGLTQDAESKKSKPEECAEKLLNYLEEYDLSKFSRKDLITLDDEYSHDTVTKAIKLLKQDGVVIENGFGKGITYSFISLRKKSHKSKIVENSEQSELEF